MPNQDEQLLRETIIKLVKEQQPKSVRELVVLTKAIISSPEQKIVEEILELQSQKRISLSRLDTSTTMRLVDYLKTADAQWFWIIIAITSGTLVAVFTIPEALIPLVYIRYALGTVYVLWLPGYTFMRALFPGKRLGKGKTESIDAIERVALSIGMSLVLVPLTGLLVNFTPLGFRLTSIVLGLLVLALIFSATALIREYHARIRLSESRSETRALAN